VERRRPARVERRLRLERQPAGLERQPAGLERQPARLELRVLEQQLARRLAPRMEFRLAAGLGTGLAARLGSRLEQRLVGLEHGLGMVGMECRLGLERLVGSRLDGLVGRARLERRLELAGGDGLDADRRRAGGDRIRGARRPDHALVLLYRAAGLLPVRADVQPRVDPGGPAGLAGGLTPCTREPPLCCWRRHSSLSAARPFRAGRR